MADFIYAGDAGAFKCCTKCGEFFNIVWFNTKSGRSDGRRSDCRACQSDANKKYSKNNRGKITAKNRQYRKENKDKVKLWSRLQSRKRRKSGEIKAYEDANKDRLSVVRAEWWARNPHKRKEYNDKYYTTPKGRVSSAIRAVFSSEIRSGSKRGRKTFSLLGYTAEELMLHLEKSFSCGMTWENYGRGGWHIDHIIPLSAFNYESPDDIDFKKAWSLKNLQPMWQRENLSKGAKLAAPFQPSFAFGC